MYDENQTNETEIDVDLTEQRQRFALLLKRCCDSLEERLTTKEASKPSPTMGDYLKLLQFMREVEKETAEEGPRDVQVTWVTPQEN